MKKKKINRITIKIGTRVLTDKNNIIDKKIIKSIVDQVSILMGKGMEVILVTSGAIGSGLGLLKLDKKRRSLSELQAIASIGQNHLMDFYNDYLGKKGYRAGQILLTQDDFSDRKRFLNISYTINTLLKFKAVPVINENDSISTEEIKCGDNDRLSSMVADIADSDMLIILTDVEGFYNDESEIIKNVANVAGQIETLKGFCKGKGCDESTGGMITKIEAVRHAAASGVTCVIARGKRKNVLLDIVSGKEVGTRFEVAKKTLKARKRWIAFSLKPKGNIEVDAGAKNAIVNKNKSLLPGGIVDVKGVFRQGDVVNVISTEKKVVARGLTNYSSGEIKKIKGKRTDKIETELGYKDYDEVVHRDNLVVM